MTEPNQEPLADVLRRWWEDTLTIREADADDLEAAKHLAFERLELDGIARRADQDRMEAELRHLAARGAELRQRLSHG